MAATDSAEISSSEGAGVSSKVPGAGVPSLLIPAGVLLPLVAGETTPLVAGVVESDDDDDDDGGVDEAVSVAG